MLKMDCDYKLIRDITDIELENFNEIMSYTKYHLKNEYKYEEFYEQELRLFCKNLKKVLQRLTPLNVNILCKVEVRNLRYEGIFRFTNIYVEVNGEKIKHIGYQVELK